MPPTLPLIDDDKADHDVALAWLIATRIREREAMKVAPPEWRQEVAEGYGSVPH